MKLVSHGLLGALEELALALKRWVDRTPRAYELEDLNIGVGIGMGMATV